MAARLSGGQGAWARFCAGRTAPHSPSVGADDAWSAYTTGDTTTDAALIIAAGMAAACLAILVVHFVQCLCYAKPAGKRRARTGNHATVSDKDSCETTPDIDGGTRSSADGVHKDDIQEEEEEEEDKRKEEDEDDDGCDDSVSLAPMARAPPTANAKACYPTLQSTDGDDGDEDDDSGNQDNKEAAVTTGRKVLWTVKWAPITESDETARAHAAERIAARQAKREQRQSPHDPQHRPKHGLLYPSVAPASKSAGESAPRRPVYPRVKASTGPHGQQQYMRRSQAAELEALARRIRDLPPPAL